MVKSANGKKKFKKYPGLKMSIAKFRAWSLKPIGKAGSRTILSRISTWSLKHLAQTESCLDQTGRFAWWLLPMSERLVLSGNIFLHFRKLNNNCFLVTTQLNFIIFK